MPTKDLRITDLRVAVVKGAPMTCPIIRIDTNQEGLYGLGEVRDGASKTYALMLKSRLVGEDPRNVDKLFRKIKPFGFHARQAGGVPTHADIEGQAIAMYADARRGDAIRAGGEEHGAGDATQARVRLHRGDECCQPGGVGHGVVVQRNEVADGGVGQGSAKRLVIARREAHVAVIHQQPQRRHPLPTRCLTTDG